MRQCEHPKMVQRPNSWTVNSTGHTQENGILLPLTLRVYMNHTLIVLCLTWVGGISS